MWFLRGSDWDAATYWFARGGHLVEEVEPWHAVQGYARVGGATIRAPSCSERCAAAG